MAFLEYDKATPAYLRDDTLVSLGDFSDYDKVVTRQAASLAANIYFDIDVKAGRDWNRPPIRPRSPGVAHGPPLESKERAAFLALFCPQ